MDNKLLIEVSGRRGKSRIIYLLKKVFRDNGFEVQFNGGRDFDDEEHFDEFIGKDFDRIIEILRNDTTVVINEVH